ncbi:hypothetical protein H4R27_000925 [Coemansia aciculifera]|nr:hypothetical protein H4R27_000925 [Coemansia aciculifera]
MIYPNLRALSTVLAIYSASVAHGAQHLEAGDALHRRQVGVVPPVVGAVTSSTPLTPVAVPGAVLPTPTLLSPTVPPTVVPTPTPVVPTSSTVKPTPPVSVLATPTRSSSTLASSSTTKPAAPRTTPTPVVPISTPTPAPAGGGVPALGGGGGSPQTGKPGPANVFTATMGSGGVLEYGSCITFESQCNDLCSHGIYSMNCVSGGICLCYDDEPESTTSDPDPSANAATDTVGSNTNLASRQLPVWSASAFALSVLSAFAISATFF